MKLQADKVGTLNGLTYLIATYIVWEFPLKQLQIETIVLCMCSRCLVLSDHSEHERTFFSQTTLLEAMSQRKVVTTGWWASGCVQSGSERQMAIAAPLCQNKLLRAPGGVHSPETFSAISPILSHFDKLSPLRNNTLHHLSEGRLLP